MDSGSSMGVIGDLNKVQPSSGRRSTGREVAAGARPETGPLGLGWGCRWVQAARAGKARGAPAPLAAAPAPPFPPAASADKVAFCRKRSTKGAVYPRPPVGRMACRNGG